MAGISSPWSTANPTGWRTECVDGALSLSLSLSLAQRLCFLTAGMTLAKEVSNTELQRSRWSEAERVSL